MKRVISRVACLTRVFVHWSALFVVALFPCATLSAGLLNVTESEAPLDVGESSEEIAISVQRRIRVRRGRSGLPLRMQMRGGSTLATDRVVRVPHAGHRLPNNLLAPLRR